MLGCCILPPKVLDQLEDNKAGVSSKIQLPEALDDLLKLDGLNALNPILALMTVEVNRDF